MMAVSRAPIDAIQTYKSRMGWTFPWASSLDDDFNYDFNVSVTEDEQRGGPVDYNYGSRDMRPVVDAIEGGPAEQAARCGTDTATYLREAPGMSAFALEDDVVYHTYSAYARGLDGLWSMYQWLDRRRRDGTRAASGFAAATSTVIRREAASAFVGAPLHPLDREEAFPSGRVKK